MVENGALVHTSLQENGKLDENGGLAHSSLLENGKMKENGNMEANGKLIHTSIESGIDDVPDDQIIAAIGEFGSWQRNKIFLLGLFLSFGAWPILSMTFMNADMNYWCSKPTNISLTKEMWRNISAEAENQCSIGTVAWDEGSPRYDNNSMSNCSSWEYDKSVFTSTITSDWDLVCEKESLVEWGQSLYFIGMISGVFLFGQLADMFGRKTILIPLLLAIALSGTITAFLPTFTGFIIGRFFNAMAVIGLFECVFTWMLEVVGGDWITIIGMGAEFFWVFGWLNLAWMSYLIRDWRHLMLATSIPAFASVVLYWWMPESPKWLLAKKKISEAETVVRSAAQANNRTLPENWKLRPLGSIVGKRKANILDLFRNRILLYKTLILFVSWFVNALAYYGLTLNMPSFGEDIFLTFFIKGLLEIPAYGIAIWILLKKGRRIPYASSLILCGMSLLCIMFVPLQEEGSQNWAAIILTLFGKSCITFSFGVVYLYSAELFPTEIRTTGIGCCSTVGRLGAIVAPWVGKLGKMYHPYVPIVICGLSALVAGILSIFLPETKGIKMPDTVAEAEMLPMGDLKSLRRKNIKA